MDVRFRDIRTSELSSLSRGQVVDLLRKAIRYTDKSALKLFRALEDSHGGLQQTDLTESKAVVLLRIVLYHTLRKSDADDPDDKSVRTLIGLLRAFRSRSPPLQVDRRLRRLGTTRLMGTRRTIPYTIVRTKSTTRARKAWLKALMDDEVVRGCIDLNRPVTAGTVRSRGNLLVASYVEAHIYDISWYTFLIEEYNVAVNSVHRGKTLKDYVLRDIRREERKALRKKRNAEPLEGLAHEDTAYTQDVSDGSSSTMPTLVQSAIPSDGSSGSSGSHSRRRSGGRDTSSPTMAQCIALLALLDKHGALTRGELKT